MSSSAEPNRDSFDILAANVRYVQASRNFTVQDLAERSGIGRRTLIRVRNGQPCTLRIQRKLAAAFNLYLDDLWSPILTQPKTLFHFDIESIRWRFADPEDAHNWPFNPEPDRSDPENIQDPAERLRLGRAKISRGFDGSMRCCLPHGRQAVAILEVFGRIAQQSTHVRYDMLYHCVRGSLRAWRGSEAVELKQGDTLIFDGDEPHAVEPITPLGPHDPPPLLLWVLLKRLPTSSRV